MLGLGSSLLHGGVSEELVATYTSDFSGGVDGWIPYSVEGTLTLDGNIDGFNGEDNTLRGTYDTTQTDSSGIKKANAFSDVRVGDRFEVTQVKIYLDSTGGSGDCWTASGPVLGAAGVYLFIQYPSGITTYPNYILGPTAAIEVDAWQTGAMDFFPLSPRTAVNTNGDIYFTFPQGNTEPQENARFYIKDIIIKQYRPIIF